MFSIVFMVKVKHCDCATVLTISNQFATRNSYMININLSVSVRKFTLISKRMLLHGDRHTIQLTRSLCACVDKFNSKSPLPLT